MATAAPYGAAATTVAEVIAAYLHAAGVRTVFGLPGGETVELLDALRRKGIDFVLVHNESSALFMADTYSRVTGGIGVCVTTLGPGATNAVMGMAHAHLDRAPIILITAQKPDALLPDYTHQVLDLHAIFRPISKATIKINQTNAAAAIRQAISLVTADRPGPVHLQLSNEDAAQPTEATQVDLPTPAPYPTPDEARLQEARSLLQSAQRPVIVAGLGLEPQRPYAALRDLAEALDAPVIVAPKGKGALPDDHPLAAGVIGLTRTDPAYAILDEADCVLALGFDVVELVKPWATDAPVIWLAPWENTDPVMPAQVELVGDLARHLAALADVAPSPNSAWGAARVARFRQSLAEDLPEPAAGRLLPQSVLATLREQLPPSTTMVVDVGSHKIYNSLSWPTLEPNTFFLSNGLSSMGFGLPAAMGAALADPQRPVVCITGDAGMAMVLGELAVLRKLNLPVLLVVLSDSAIDLIRAAQLRAEKPVFGTEFTPPDFCRIASAYRLPAAHIADTDALAAAVQEFMADPQPRLLEVMLDPVSYPTTPRKATAQR